MSVMYFTHLKSDSEKFFFCDTVSSVLVFQQVSSSDFTIIDVPSRYISSIKFPSSFGNGGWFGIAPSCVLVVFRARYSICNCCTSNYRYKDGRVMPGRSSGDLLVVSGVTREDQGMYQCMARRAEGETGQASAQLQLGGQST